MLIIGEDILLILQRGSMIIRMNDQLLLSNGVLRFICHLWDAK